MQVEKAIQVEQDIPSSCRLRVCLHGPLEVWKRTADGAWKPVEKEAWGKGRPAVPSSSDCWQRLDGGFHAAPSRMISGRIPRTLSLLIKMSTMRSTRFAG